jgi:hypothetical protein
VGQRVGGAVKYNDAKSMTLCTLALHQRELGVSMRNLTSIGLEPKAKGLPRRRQVYKKLRITK